MPSSPGNDNTFWKLVGVCVAKGLISRRYTPKKSHKRATITLTYLGPRSVDMELESSAFARGM